MKKLNLDISRLIASLMVVAIHTYPLSSINGTLDYCFTRIICRISVPIFLMITGYYVLNKDIDYLKKYTIKIIKIYLISILIYIPINIYNGYINDFNIIKLIKDIFINGTFYTLWYFPALVLGLWITYYLIKKLNTKLVKIVLIILFIIGILGDGYYGLIKDIDILKQIYDVIFMVFDYTRNGLFYVPIFLYIGYQFNINKNDFKYNKYYIILFLILMVIEGIILYMFNIPKHNSMYIFLLPLSYFIFNTLINNKSSNKMARSLSTWIYILHPLFIVIIHFISKIIHINIYSNSILNYILVVFLTSTFIIIVNKLLQLIKKHI